MDDEGLPGAERIDVLFRAHAATILGYARARLPQDAEDVVSETFAVAWRRIDDVPDPALPWLLRTARNKIGDRLRAAHRFSGLITRLEVTAGWRRDPTERLGETQIVQRALDRLRPADRDVVELLVAADLTNAELASVLGCSEAAAYARCSRARKRLRAALAVEEAGVTARSLGEATAAPVLHGSRDGREASRSLEAAGAAPTRVLHSSRDGGEVSRLPVTARATPAALSRPDEQRQGLIVHHAASPHPGERQLTWTTPTAPTQASPRLSGRQEYGVRHAATVAAPAVTME